MSEPRGMPDPRASSREPGEGLPAEASRRPGASVAAGLGALWGLVSYSILWEGMPAQVDRAFVESPGGTLVLLPSRIAIWSIAVAEAAAGRSFDLSRTFDWIAPFATAIGAGLMLACYLAVRTITRRIRIS